MPPKARTQSHGKRHLVSRPSTHISKPALKRLARRGGVVRINNDIYDAARGLLRAFLENVVRDAAVYTAHGRRRTVTSLDVVYALKRNGHTMYGFGG